MRKMTNFLKQLRNCTALFFTCVLHANSYEIKVQPHWLNTMQAATPSDISAKNELRRISHAYAQASNKMDDDAANLASTTTHIDPEEIPADLAYWIADIKLDEHGVKIVEFGDGNFAGYKVLDNMYYPGKMWGTVWLNLLKIGIPIWYVGDYASNPGVVAWSSFKANGGSYSPSLDILQRNVEFLRHAKRRTPLFPAKITDYQGIIVLKRYNPPMESFERFIKKYPDFLILNDTSTMHVSDKRLTDSLFNTEELKAFRPKAIIMPKEYTETLAQEILTQIDANWMVIKPINSGRGNGIIMTSRENLDKELRKVLIDNKNNLSKNNEVSFKPDPPLSYEYWKGDRNTHFLVEEFAESKAITVNNKPYDATMRVIFMMRYEEGTIKMDYLDAYWKRPIKALNERGTFKEKHISKHAPSYEESQGLAVSSEDFALVQKSMSQALPQVYWNILSSYYGQNQ